MKLAKAKEYYALGLISGLWAVQASSGCVEGWILVLDSSVGQAGSHSLKTALGEEKFYATLDSLNRDVVRIIGSRQSWSMRL